MAFAWLALLANCLFVSAAESDSPPNVLVILADDLGYGDLGAYNPESKIPTSHLNRLAREGMRFTDAHSPGAVCVPTRYGLMTGRYPFRAELDWRRRAGDRAGADDDRLAAGRSGLPDGDGRQVAPPASTAGRTTTTTSR